MPSEQHVHRSRTLCSAARPHVRRSAAGLLVTLSRFVQLEQADLSNADLSSADLSGADLDSADISGARLP
ncbi:pentapeptide repeat-containing protein [Halorubrum halophilum]|uniref:pentapeptide repeat-containing protein n=1 Tax=Halorubrum halophilum TaxID=413816 RepID=UPI001F2BA2C6